MKYIIFCFSLLAPELFFAINSLIGTTYIGKEESPLYIIYCITLFFLSIFFAIRDIFSKKWVLNKYNCFILVPVVMIYIFIFEYMILGSSNNVLNFFLLHVVFSIPAFYIGIYISNNNELWKLYRLFEIAAIIFACAVILVLPQLYLLGSIELGGATYQSVSYIGAFCFGIIFFIVIGKDRYRFTILNNIFSRIFLILILPLLAISVLTSGGRGGALLLILNFIIVLLYYSKSAKTLKPIVFGILLVLSLVIIIPLLSIDATTYLTRGFERAFSYLTTSGIDMESTSGRDDFYGIALHDISKNPLMGYGFFRYYDESTIKFYPHNILLEMLLQGGFIYVLFSGLVFVYLIIKLVKIKNNANNKIKFMLICSYPSTMLLFSGSYMSNALFWFCLSYIISYSTNNKQ